MVVLSEYDCHWSRSDDANSLVAKRLILFENGNELTREKINFRFTITAKPLWELKDSVLARLFRVLLKSLILANYNLQICVKV